MSPLTIEHPGPWRGIVLGILLVLVGFPLVPLVQTAVVADGIALTGAFWRSLLTSAQIAGAAGAAGFVIGLPLGVTIALAGFAGRRFVLTAIALPLVVPSFLWAIGWSTLAAHLPVARMVAAGATGCMVVAATTTAVLVVLAAYAATLELSRSQVEAALLAGGERALLRRASRHAMAPAGFAAVLGAVLTLSDAGPGQILGTHTVASEILTSFAARYDLALAAKQCLALMLVVVTVALPLACVAGPRIAHAVLARQQTTPPSRHHTVLSVAGATGGAIFVTLAIVPPIVALTLPLIGTREALIAGAHAGGSGADPVLTAALATTARTAFNTVLYAGGAGVLAAAIAFTTAVAIGRSVRLRSAAMTMCIMVFAWPSAAGSLGFAHLAATAPPALDVLLRSRLSVCVVLGLHLTPIATALALRAIGSLAPSWSHAAALHGIGFGRYARHVLWPALRASIALSIALAALLASADAGSVLLLHPPGEPSLPLAIFTVMANAPEATVAALCLVYLVGTTILLAVAGAAVERGVPS